MYTVKRVHDNGHDRPLVWLIALTLMEPEAFMEEWGEGRLAAYSLTKQGDGYATYEVAFLLGHNKDRDSIHFKKLAGEIRCNQLLEGDALHYL